MAVGREAREIVALKLLSYSAVVSPQVRTYGAMVRHLSCVPVCLRRFINATIVNGIARRNHLLTKVDAADSAPYQRAAKRLCRASFRATRRSSALRQTIVLGPIKPSR